MYYFVMQQAVHVLLFCNRPYMYHCFAAVYYCYAAGCTCMYYCVLQQAVHVHVADVDTDDDDVITPSIVCSVFALRWQILTMLEL